MNYPGYPLQHPSHPGGNPNPPPDINMLNFHPIPPNPNLERVPPPTIPYPFSPPHHTSMSFGSASSSMHGDEDVPMPTTPYSFPGAESLISPPLANPAHSLGAPSPRQVEKGKSGSRKRRSGTGQSIIGQDGFVYKPSNLREYVLKILQYRHMDFSDLDFAERALTNLARKVSSSPNNMIVWEMAVSGQDKTSCIRVTRPKDGRMTVAKTPQASTKKVFPQIILCQIFRWPSIIFHNDIRSVEICKYRVPVKPVIIEGGQPLSQVVEGIEEICVNPFHYDLSPEAKRKLNRAAKKAARKNSQSASNKTSTAKASVEKKNPQAQKKGPSSSTSSSNTEVQDFDNQGIDYIKMWKEKAQPVSESGVIHKFNQEEILKEIKFLNLSNGKECSDYLKKKLGLYKSTDPILKDEFIKQIQKLRKRIAETRRAKQGQKSAENKTTTAKTSSSDMPSQSSVSPKSAKVDETEKKNESMPSTEKNKSHEKALSDIDDSALDNSPEDVAIQDLLNDIRGSFERQFDEEFEDLTKAALANAPDDNDFESLDDNFTMPENLENIELPSNPPPDESKPVEGPSNQQPSPKQYQQQQTAAERSPNPNPAHKPSTSSTSSSSTIKPQPSPYSNSANHSPNPSTPIQQQQPPPYPRQPPHLPPHLPSPLHPIAAHHLLLDPAISSHMSLGPVTQSQHPHQPQYYHQGSRSEVPCVIDSAWSIPRTSGEGFGQFPGGIYGSATDHHHPQLYGFDQRHIQPQNNQQQQQTPHQMYPQYSEQHPFFNQMNFNQSNNM